jgi:hypothetical protein
MSQILDQHGISAENEPTFARPNGLCPLNHGVAVLDQMMAALLKEGDSASLDAALDLRCLLAGSSDATAIVREFYRLRAQIEEHHYLACYRLRRWLEANLIAWVAPDRHLAPVRTGLRLDCANFDALRERCAALALDDTRLTPWTRVRFAFAEQTQPAILS